MLVLKEREDAVVVEKLQGMYEAVAGWIEDVAERILQIGSRPLVNLAEYAERSASTVRALDSA